MRILIFDPFHGAAGDMITASLLDCGADRGLVMQAMRSVVTEPAISHVSRGGIRATILDTRAPPAHRTFPEVLTLLDGAAGTVPPPALAVARRVFARIHAAEEQVHGRHAHFHEVGADDAIADVIGACTALFSLAVDGVVVLPVSLGYGTVTCSHGTLPVPAPSTAAILTGTGLAMRSGTDEGELCTPTGAALLAEFSSMKPSDLGPYTITAIGYGAGSTDPVHTPNVLRAMVVETSAGTGMLPRDAVYVLETNVDDVSGEVIAHTISRCMEAGARDAGAIPIIMKKGRPGFLMTVIATADTVAGLAGLLARELGTLGIRCTPAVHRFIADRTHREVSVTIDGQARTMPVKCGWMQGEVYTLKAEFDPAGAWADELGIPVRDVLRAIEAEGWKTIRHAPAGSGDQ